MESGNTPSVAMARVAEFHTSDTDEEVVDDEASRWSRSCASPPAVIPDLHPGGEQSPHIDRRELRRGDHRILLPVFTPGVHHLSSINVDGRITLDSDSESSYVDEFALDLFDGGSPRRERAGALQLDFSASSVDSLSVGVFDGVEDMGSDYLDLWPELELGLGLEKSKDVEGGTGTDSEDDEELGLGGDAFFVGGGGTTSALGAAGSDPSMSPEGEGLRIAGFGSDSDSDEVVEIGRGMITNFEGGDVPDLGLSLYWDGLRIEEERGEPSLDFDWEEDGVTMNDTDVFSSIIVDEDCSIASPSPEETSDLGLQEGERDTDTVVWEVLLAMNNLDRNAPLEAEDAGSYQGEEQSDHYIDTSEYEVLFDQFVDHENFIKGGPPASKLVIEHLPSVVLTQLDVANNNTICAVCKDELSLEERVKRLPCSHHYHTGCILPWLRIRNTCPVCRHELPTDDPHYENWRSWRAASSVAVEDSQVRYEIEMFPGE